MGRIAANVPAETDVLCEGCGYVLNGLPPDSRCPECGKPIVESTGPDVRHVPAWENAAPAGPASSVGGFFRTTARVLFAPKRFYRTLTTRRQTRDAVYFAWIHWAAASLLFGVAATFHWFWYVTFTASSMYMDALHGAALAAVVSAVIFLVLGLTTKLAAKLTHWEATYRGYRMPYAAVLRGLHYHAAHYLPVAAMAAVTVLGYHYLVTAGKVGLFPSSSAYLYTLCAEVIFAAGYLFQTYWIGMRNMMYANL